MFGKIVRSSAGRLQVASRHVATRSYAAHVTPQPFNWQDPLGSMNLLTDEELAIAETAESYCQERMLPRILGKPFECMEELC